MTNIECDINNAKIVLIGEDHGIDWIHDKVLSIWKKFYNRGVRHFFIESAYFTGEYLNLWMKSENDTIFNELFKDLENTGSNNQGYINFFMNIKRECPLTVFHGTDVGHQYWSTGKRFLEYLQTNNLQETEQYLLTLEAIEQGKKFYLNKKNGYCDDHFRENTMAENFIREYNKLENEQIMGNFGSAHTNYNEQAYYGNYPNMAKLLRMHYGNIIYFENYNEK